MFKIALVSLAIASASAAYSDAKASPVYSIEGRNVTEIQRCGMEWKATKPHVGIQWPSYWSACAKTIKANNSAGAAKVGTMKIDLSTLPKVAPIEVSK